MHSITIGCGGGDAAGCSKGAVFLDVQPFSTCTSTANNANSNTHYTFHTRAKVTVRPAASDILSAIKENRPVKTEVTMRFA